MLLFYAPDITTATTHYVLPEDESRHCLKVMRLQVGDEIFLTNGQGTLFKVKIAVNDLHACMVEIVEAIDNYQPMDYYLHLAVAPTKNTDRFEWFAEKAVEIGVSKITTLCCENSERTSIKSDRIVRLMIAAMKQSLRAYLPSLEVNVGFKDFIRQSQTFAGQKLIAYCGIASQASVPLPEALKKDKSALVLIGPEGDFSPQEVELALANGFVPVSMGDMRLRTETAALMACATACVVNQKL